jgi:hypothetical protein
MIPNFDFAKVKTTDDLIKYLESYHGAQEVTSKNRHRIIVIITIGSLFLTIIGLLFQGYIHLNNQSDMIEINKQQKTIDIERNELLKLHLLRLDHLANDTVKLKRKNPKTLTQ